MSNFFSISRGWRQGGPVSSYLFIICAEILALKIRENDIKITRVEHISNQSFQTSLNWDRNEKSLQESLLVYLIGLLVHKDWILTILKHDCYGYIARNLFRLKILWNNGLKSYCNWKNNCGKTLVVKHLLYMYLYWTIWLSLCQILQTIISHINDIVYEFAWNSYTHRVKQDGLIKDLHQGDSRYWILIQALKSTCIRNIIQRDNFFSCGTGYM